MYNSSERKNIYTLLISLVDLYCLFQYFNLTIININYRKLNNDDDDNNVFL